MKKSRLESPAVVGDFHGVRDGAAIGWALRRDDPSSKLQVEIRSGARVLATGIAECLHNGLAQKGVGDGRFGFVIPLPGGLEAGGPIRVAAFAHAGDARDAEQLGMAQLVGRAGPIGVIDGVANGQLFGWYSTALADGPTVIEVRVGDRTVGKLVPGLRRKDLASFDAAAGFTHDLRPLLREHGGLPFTVSLIDAATGTHLGRSPLEIGRRATWGGVDGDDPLSLSGWMVQEGADNSDARVQLLVDGRVVVQQSANLFRADLARMGVRTSRCGFRLQVPGRFLDGRPHELEVRDARSGETLNGGRKTFKATVRHGIAHATSDRISGWIFIEEFPRLRLNLEARVDETLIGSGRADRPFPAPLQEIRQECGIGSCGFTLPLSFPATGAHLPRRIRLCLPGSDDSVTGSDLLVTTGAFLVREAERMAAGADEAFRWWVQDWIDRYRKTAPEDPLLFREVPARGAADDGVIDVIIPVYKGHAQTLKCLNSVLDAREPARHEIVVINDASPDAELAAELRKMAEAKRITLVEMAVNSGFVASVNRGMRIHPGRDVLLLNSDTVVPSSDWLSRIAQAAKRDPRIGTVTPLSNRATICSLPAPVCDNVIPAGFDVDKLDELCRQTNPAVSVDLPTAIGFCMYIRRKALDEAGYFDEVTWGRGYGEENDFCLRASAVGWRNVAACDVFVEHEGSVSFGDSRNELAAANLSKLDALYPDYLANVADFIRRDPLAGPRNGVVTRLLSTQARSFVVHVVHRWGGGVRHHVDNACRKAAGKREGHLILCPTGEGHLKLEHPPSGIVMQMPEKELLGELVGCLRALNVSSFHIHQWIGFHADVWELPALLEVPLDFTVHDYFAFCPRIHLLDPMDRYCGQPDDPGECEGCLNAAPLQAEVRKSMRNAADSVGEWREFHRTKLATARRIVAPTRDAASRLARGLGLRGVSVKAHPEERLIFSARPLPGPGTELRIAVIGAIGATKGLKTLLELCRNAQSAASSLRFVVVGYTADDEAFASLDNVDILGAYAQDELPEILRRADCHLSLFLSPCPETYSYTLSEALRAGLTPVVPDLGALGERVRKMGGGHVLPAPLNSRAVLELLTRWAGKAVPTP